MKITKNNYQAYFLDYAEGALQPEQVAELMLFLEMHPELKEELDSFENIILGSETALFDSKEQLKKETITHSNANHFFVAYYEDKLSEAEKKAVLDLVADNSALKKEFEQYGKVKKVYPELAYFPDKNKLKVSFEPVNENNYEMYFALAADNSLSRAEKNALAVFIENNPHLQKDLDLYSASVLLPDTSIVYSNKHKLKKTANVISIRRVLSAAASVALLAGLAYVFLQNEIQYGTSLSEYNYNAPELSLPLQKKTNNSTVVGDVKSGGTKNHIVTLSHSKSSQVKNNSTDVVNVDYIKDSVSAIVENSLPVPPVQSFPDKILVNPFPIENPKSENEFLSVGEWAALQMKKRFLKEEVSDGNTYNEDKKRITWYDVNLLVSKGIKKITGKDFGMKKQYDYNGDLIAYQFVAGKYVYNRPAEK